MEDILISIQVTCTNDKNTYNQIEIDLNNAVLAYEKAIVAKNVSELKSQNEKEAHISICINKHKVNDFIDFTSFLGCCLYTAIDQKFL